MDNLPHAGLRTYVRNFLATPTINTPSSKRGYYRSNPVFHRLRSNARDPIAAKAIREFFSSTDHEKIRCGIEDVARMSDTFDAGMATGYALNPKDTSIEMLVEGIDAKPSEEFVRGMREGQAYAILSNAPKAKKIARGFKILLGSALAASIVGQTRGKMTLEDVETMQSISKPLLYGFGASYLYGNITMLWSKLLGNDGCNPQKLITKGPFRMHRNPFYASMMACLATGLTYLGAMSVMSTPLTLPFVAAMTAGAGYSVRQYNLNVLNDEKRLEVLFGDEYRDYKKTTPRYFPAFWKLFRKK